MKKNVFYIVVLLFSVSNTANVFGKNALTIRFSDPGNYLVLLGDLKFTAKNVFQLKGIEEGVYPLRIVQQIFNPYMDDMNRTVVYNNNIQIRKNTHTTATLRRNGALVINSVRTLHDFQDEHGAIESEETICVRKMSIFQLSDLKKVVRATSYSKGKLNVMKQSVKLYGATPFQIKELMKYLPNERDRLELASFSYQFVDQKERYFIVNTGFKDKRSVGYLNKRISS